MHRLRGVGIDLRIDRRQRPEQTEQAPALAAQKIPVAAVVLVGLDDTRARGFEPLRLLLIQIAEKAPVEAPLRSQRHRHDHANRREQHRQEQLGGDARRETTPENFGQVSCTHKAGQRPRDAASHQNRQLNINIR